MTGAGGGNGGSSVRAAAELLGGLARVEEPLGPRCTYRVGGAARLFVQVDDEASLCAVAGAVRDTGVATLLVGQGSNLLVADSGFDGLAIALGPGFAQVEVRGTTVIVGGAAPLPMVARRVTTLGLRGFEWAVGVPGSTGGAVRMNAGGHGSDMAASVASVTLVDLAAAVERRLDLTDLAFGYRRSSIAAHQVVTSVELSLTAGDATAGEAMLSEIVSWRRAHQPGGANAGSVFTNPAGDSAGRLIDAAGLKGARIGSAQVSTKHANFIQVDPGGSAGDVFRLMALIRARVVDVAGIELHAETVMVGFEDPSDTGPSFEDQSDTGPGFEDQSDTGPSFEDPSDTGSSFEDPSDTGSSFEDPSDTDPAAGGLR